jgi:hypothetical protein
MHRKIGDPEVIPLTRKLAVEFSQLPTFKGDRQRDTVAGKARIAWLERLLADGKFYTPKWATVKLNGVLYRVNGGHSSLMLANCPEEIFPADMKVVIDRFECDTRHDLADLFDQFDPRRSIRSASEKINAHKGVHNDLDETSPTDINKCISGIAFYLTDDGASKRLDEEERMGLIHEYREFIIWASQFTGRRHLGFVGLVAAMFATYNKSKKAADAFWKQVANEDHPDAKNASRVLAMFLRDSVAMFKPNSREPKWPPRAYYVKSLHAWNAWRRDEVTSLSYYPNAPWPKAM